jgi:hypothetical protein
MQNLNTSQIAPLTLDFQKANKSFSSTKMKATQRYIRELLNEGPAEALKHSKPSTADQLFSEIKGLLADF